MSEQEQYHTPENTDQQTEKRTDVMSLKMIQMTTAEYNYYGDLYPDDPKLDEFLQRHGVMPGESIIVSATDAEHPENNLSLVIATGEDSFTTNRALTDELKVSLLEQDGSAERVRADEDNKEPGGALHGVAGVEVSEVSSEHESSKATDLNLDLVKGAIGSLYGITENFRQAPEAEGRHHKDIYIMREAASAHDAFKSGKISADSYSVLANTLLGASGSHVPVEAIVNTLIDAKVLDADATADLVSHAGSISEIAALAGLERERARISYANSLIAQSENLLEKDNYVASGRYKAMVGFIMGLSTQIKDYSASSGFVNGALGRLKQYS